jgi:hypothetical protein
MYDRKTFIVQATDKNGSVLFRDKRQKLSFPSLPATPKTFFLPRTFPFLEDCQFDVYMPINS